MRRVIWLQIPEVLNGNGFNDVRQREINMTEPLVPESSDFEVEMTTGKP